MQCMSQNHVEQKHNLDSPPNYILMPNSSLLLFRIKHIFFAAVTILALCIKRLFTTLRLTARMWRHTTTETDSRWTEWLLTNYIWITEGKMLGLVCVCMHVWHQRDTNEQFGYKKRIRGKNQLHKHRQRLPPTHRPYFHCSIPLTLL